MRHDALLQVWRIALLMLLLGVGGAVVAETEETDFVAVLEQAEALHTSTPWRETRILLDRIRDQIDQVDEPLKVRFYYLDARTRALSGEFRLGLQQVRDALELDMPPEQRVHMLRLGANLAVIVREFEVTFSMLSEALTWLGRDDIEPGDYGVYSLASYIYTRVGELDRGIRFGQRAVDVSQRYGTERDLCTAEQRLGFSYKVAERFAEAEAAYKSAIQRCLASGDELIAGVTMSGLADMYRAAGRFDGLNEQFAAAVELLRRTEFANGLAEAQLYWARLKSGQGDQAGAAALLEAAIPTFEGDQDWDYLAEANMLLAEYERAEGRLDAALNHYDAYIQAREQFLDSERARRLAFLEVEFDLRHKEQQLALLAEQARVSELQAETRKQQARLTAVGTLLALVLALIMAMLLIQSGRERRRFQRLSRRDGLTGVLNHTHFFETAETLLAECRQEGRPFTLVLADIDHFKRVNDQYGHGIGDEVLRMVAARLRESFEGSGLIGRIGGEEFAIALPDCGPDEAEPKLELLGMALRLVRADDREIPITMSFGIAEPAGARESLVSCRERADHALYMAKETGRNRIVHA